MTADSLRVFVGWDSREIAAYAVCCHSLQRRASIPIDFFPLKIEHLRAQGHFWREEDPLATTEFTYTRFLAPYLTGYRGRVLYCDCDFLWLSDVAELLEMFDPGKAVQCVHHDYRPRDVVKMDGKPQTSYPRKNWSSLMLFNCEHPSTRSLTPASVNRQTGAYLHRMQWAADKDIGVLPAEWNWLEGWDERPAEGLPKAVHFTRGGPWFDQWQSVDYADLWFDEHDLLSRLTAANP